MKVSGDELSEMYVYDSMLTLAGKIEGLFPHHAKCIRDEMIVWTMGKDEQWHSSPRFMTDQRWNRVADIIGSLASLPGTLLSEEAKHVRLHALCQGEAARAMARHRFGGKRAFGALELALFIAVPDAPGTQAP